MKNRFKAVEMGIFAVVSLIFLNSVYNLFTDGKFIGDNDRQALSQPKPAVLPIGEKAGDGRQISSEGISGFVPYETRCQTSGEVFETKAAKVRILGPFCGASGRQLAGASAGDTKAEAALTDYKIENVTSHYTATVFSDHASGKFSTDFIPLEPGENKVIMEFKYRNGKVFPVELTIIRK